MKYLIVQLCDASVSFCHYSPSISQPRLISLADLRAGLLWAIKAGVDIQILYPEYPIPKAYEDVIANINHISVKPENSSKGDVVVLSGWNSLRLNRNYEVPVVLRTTIKDFVANNQILSSALSMFKRVNIVFTDVNNFDDSLIESYTECLRRLINPIFNLFMKGQYVQVNLLTDRLILDKMNNCNAGVECITLSPDGNFYVCPAFYLEHLSNIGSPTKGLNILNNQLYKVQYAPICRECDAYHCHRCIWLNQHLTYEVNTPGHEQCVMAHVERKVSRELLSKIRQVCDFMPEIKIPDLEYLDPFYKIINQHKVI